MMETRFPPEYTRRYGCAELHGALFQHRTDRGGPAPAIAIMIPEGRDQLGTALREARRCKARVMFNCDTQEQAEEMAQLAARELPRHRRVSIERAFAGGWGFLGHAGQRRRSRPPAASDPACEQIAAG